VTVGWTSLRPGYDISPVICGGWQRAGGHGSFDRREAIEGFFVYAHAGILTFDCADIYTGVEELIGAFRVEYAKRRGAHALSRIKVHTKFVPDLEGLASLTRAKVRATIERSLKRLRLERLDLVQFHWWDYSVPGMAEAALWLEELRVEGKIDLIGGTNFDTPHTEALVKAGVPLASMQVQYSLLDARPQNGLIDACRKHNIHLLVYGTVAGGFLSDKWLGKPEPRPPFENRSLTKYKLIIDDFGGWSLFQELLRALRLIADRHGTDVATVASRAMLDRPMVAGVIVGARNRAHLESNIAITETPLGNEDRALIDEVLAKRKGPLGDTFTLERDRTGRHGSIMKYNLSKEPA